jgi:3-oxoacyl-[acyl-carrier protein] reductase
MVDARSDLLGLAGKAALVVGGGRGAGEACAVALAKAGCDVAILDVESARANEVAAKVKEWNVKGHAVIGDILDERAVAGVVSEAEDKLGRLDILVTIVGGGERKPLLETSGEDFDHQLAANLRYVFLVARAFAATCIRRGTPGAATFVSSIGAYVAPAGLGSYGVAKAGLNSLVRYMAVEWAEHGIRVNAVAPGSILTPRRPDTEESRSVLRNSMVPMRRHGTPEEVAGPILFLSSGLASYVTGQTMPVDGGALIAHLLPTA